MKIVINNIDIGTSFNSLDAGAIFRPLENNHEGRLYMKIHRPADGAYLANAIRMEENAFTPDWFMLNEKVKEISAQLVVGEDDD